MTGFVRLFCLLCCFKFYVQVSNRLGVVDRIASVVVVFFYSGDDVRGPLFSENVPVRVLFASMWSFL